MLPAMVLQFGLLFVLKSESTRNTHKATLGALSFGQLVSIIVGVLGALGALLLLTTMARFKRSRLVLSWGTTGHLAKKKIGHPKRGGRTSVPYIAVEPIIPLQRPLRLGGFCSIISLERLESRFYLENANFGYIRPPRARKRL